MERGAHAFPRKTRNILLHINQQLTLILNLSQRRREGRSQHEGLWLLHSSVCHGRLEANLTRSAGRGREVSRS